MRPYTEGRFEPGFDLGSTVGESSVLTARLHML